MPGQFPHIAWAAEVAAQFWARVSDCGQIASDELRGLASRNREAVERFGRVFGRRG